MFKSGLQAGWRVASPHHRKFGVDRLNLIGLSLRVAAVALLSAVIWMHLHLWEEGYKHIPTIGPLFLVGTFSVLAAAAVLLVWPSRLIGLLALVVDLGILASLITSINVGLFGFKESLNGPFVVESIVIEALAAAALTLWVATDYAAENQTSLTLVSTAHDDFEEVDHQSWRRRARQAEADADDLAFALEFHIVNECDCHGAADIATLRRHDIRAISRHRGAANPGHTPRVNGAHRASRPRSKSRPDHPLPSFDLGAAASAFVPIPGPIRYPPELACALPVRWPFHVDR